MRKAKVFPLPVLAAAKTSLQRSKGDDSIGKPPFSRGRWDERAEAYLPSSRGRIVLCWISVMCSKPNSLTPFSVFSLTSSAREANDVSSNAPVKSGKLRQRLIMSLSWTCPCSHSCQELLMILLTKMTTRVTVCLSWHPWEDGKPKRATLRGKMAEFCFDLRSQQMIEEDVREIRAMVYMFKRYYLFLTR